MSKYYLLDPADSDLALFPFVSVADSKNWLQREGINLEIEQQVIKSRYNNENTTTYNIKLIT